MTMIQYVCKHLDFKWYNLTDFRRIYLQIDLSGLWIEVPGN